MNKKLEKILFKDGVLLTEKRLWTITMIIVIALSLYIMVPAFWKLFTL